MRAAGFVVALALLPASAVAGAEQTDDPLQRLLGSPVVAADIASAVGDCVAKDGDAQALGEMGYAKVGDLAPGGQMVGYRRGASGPLLVLPGVRNALRCWVLSNPAETQAAVVDAIGGTLGTANRGGGGTPGWRVHDYSLTFDWFDEAGKPRLNRVEIYKFPQESK